MSTLPFFFIDAIKQVFRGDRLYWIWMAVLVAVIGTGVANYSDQFARGLIVTGMSDQVSWGAYIANFTFLVGVAAAAVMLVIPAYVFHIDDIKHVVLIGEGIAVAAVAMCMTFVLVDLGRPDRFWHMIPLLGRFNFPLSLLAWDVVVLTGYLLLNLLIPLYILHERYAGREPNMRAVFPFIMLSIGWAISIHTVTAFLFSSNVARPFWNTAVLGPRFLASAFASGPALIILALQVIGKVTVLEVHQNVLHFLRRVTTISLQINLFLLGVEIFTDFYNHPDHSASAQYLFFGLHGYNTLVPWIWTAVAFNVTAVLVLMIPALNRHWPLVNISCGLIVVGVWIEKGMGLIIPGFIPTPIGEVFEYSPSVQEVLISLGVWAFGILVFTVLAKVAIPIEAGTLVHRSASAPRRGSDASGAARH